MPPVLTLKEIKLSFGGAPLIDGAEMSLSPGDRACLVGRNGAGKSTFLKIAAGLIDADGGDRFVQPGVTIAYLPQEADFEGYSTAADFVREGLRAEDRGNSHEVEAALDEVGLDPKADPSRFSGGEKRRAALARAFVGDPDILMLDEPTNHLDIATIGWLEKRLKSFRGALIVISHDRAFLKNLTTACLWLDRGRVRRLKKGFGHFEEWADQILEDEEKERQRLNKRIGQEMHWLNRGVTARRARNMGRLRRLQDMRARRQNWISSGGSLSLKMDEGDKSGTMVIEAKAIHKGFPTPDGERVIVDNFSTRIMRGDQIGIVGPNGAGKTTLLRMLTGHLKPDSGKVRLGTNLTTVFLDQMREPLQATKTPWEIFCPMGGDQINVRGSHRHVVGYLKEFLFDVSQVRQPVGSLSGGERNRLLLALALAKPSNLLVLDEPTNDLDMQTLDLLQDMLASYEGTLLLVSHDRDFLDRTVASTIVMEGDGQVKEYAGGYSDYLVQKGLSEGEAPQPAKAPAPKKEPAAPKQSKAATKLSYKDARRLEQLQDEIPELEAAIADLEAKLADPDLFARDAAAFQTLAAKLEEAKAKLASAEEEWLDMEMKREEMESGAAG